MAGAPGFEPGMPVPKTGALPLGYAPKQITERFRGGDRLIASRISLCNPLKSDFNILNQSKADQSCIFAIHHWFWH